MADVFAGTDIVINNHERNVRNEYSHKKHKYANKWQHP